MHQNQIAPDCVQELFDSARNAGDKGLAQYFTPPEVARVLATALAPFRPVITDLHCGDGGLLRACANASTTDLLGCDIARGWDRRRAGQSASADRASRAPHSHAFRRDAGPEADRRDACPTHFVQGDVTKFHSFLVHAGWQGDVFALNPPFDLHHPREHLKLLADSSCDAVREAFAAWDGRTPRDCVDSFIAGFCMALDRCGENGEGFIIANRNTAFRLLINNDAPHHALHRHLWGLVELGNTFSVDCVALFFARAVQDYDRVLSFPLSTLTSQPSTVRTYRRGISPGPAFITEDSLGRWQAAQHGYAVAQQRRRDDWNIGINADGTLWTWLSIYDQVNVTIPKDEAEELFTLNGQRPMQLVMQKNTRRVLMKHAGLNSQLSTLNPQPPLWRVAPAVVAAVQQALDDYNTQRAPLWPLTETMRLGWLDEEDSVRCKKDFMGGTGVPPVSAPQRTEPPARHECPTSSTSGRDARPAEAGPQPGRLCHPLFRAGETYALATRTLTVTRAAEIRNLEGEFEDVHRSGKELAFIITDGGGVARTFRMARENEVAVRDANRNQVDEGAVYPMEKLVEHFHIPEVIDIAAAQPERYEQMRARLKELEELTEQIK